MIQTRPASQRRFLFCTPAVSLGLRPGPSLYTGGKAARTPLRHLPVCTLAWWRAWALRMCVTMLSQHCIYLATSSQNMIQNLIVSSYYMYVMRNVSTTLL